MNKIRNLLNKLKSSFYKFMYGRYGVDEFSNFILKISFIPIIPLLFTKGIARLIFTLIFWALIIYCYFRIFSKNIYKRQTENEWFKSKKKYLKTRITQRKNYRFYDCPKCHTHLRVPKGVGKITITCKKCGYQFDKKA